MGTSSDQVASIIAWFARIVYSRATGDRETERLARSQLRDCGVEIRFLKDRAPR